MKIIDILFTNYKYNYIFNRIEQRQNTFSFLQAKNNFRNISLSNVVSLILLRNLVQKSPLAENTRSASTEVGGIRRRAWCRSCNAVVCFRPAMKRPISFVKVFWTSELVPIELCCLRKSESCFAMVGTDVTSTIGWASQVESGTSTSSVKSRWWRALAFLVIVALVGILYSLSLLLKLSGFSKNLTRDTRLLFLRFRYRVS